MGPTVSSGMRASKRTARAGQAGILTTACLVVFAAGTGCSQKFTESCAETRSCPGSTGGEGGDDGSGGSGGSSSGTTGSSGGSAGESGASGGDACGGCGKGKTCCDDQCVDTSSDAANCGACGVVCEGAHAEFVCVDSECVVSKCQKGYVDCGDASDGCETKDAGLPGVPSPYLPMAGAYTGAVRAERSLKPTFAWRAPGEEGTCDVFTYEIELTRECVPGKLQECAFEDVDVREAGIEVSEWTPEEPLPVSEVVPVGALYAWRVRACEAPDRCSAWSRVSYVNVGRLIDDINGDGYSDLVELDGGAQAWFSSGNALTPLASISVVPESVIGSPMTPHRGRFLGDVNGDGFPDMLLWNTSNVSTSNLPVLLLGASTVSAWTSVPIPFPALAYSQSARVGDLDADGFADVALVEIDAPSAEQKPSVLRLYRGKADFTWSSPSTLPAPGGPSLAFGAALVGGLDSNGDGYSDLFVLDDAKGALHLAYGGTSLPVVIAASVESGTFVSNGYAQSDLMDLGDRNGDGFSDVAAFVTNSGESLNSAIQIFHGGPELPQVPAASLVVNARYGVEWFGGYDLGEDGRADLLVTTINDDQYGYYRGPFGALPGSENEQSAADLVEVGDLGPSLQKAGLSGGDYDGDGVIDLTIRVQETQRKVLRGGRPAETSATCSQPPASFPEIGDWCSVESDTFAIPSKYTNPNKTVR